jgi:hypothetical protein
MGRHNFMHGTVTPPWFFARGWLIIFPLARSFNSESQPMSLDEKIEALKLKHHKLEDALEEEENRPQPDEIEISVIKKQKLRIKDQLASLAAH